MTVTIYKVTHTRQDGTEKLYVGLTVRPLTERLRAHFYQASRNRGVRNDSLGEAIRMERKENRGHSRFTIAPLQKCSLMEAAMAEASWIEKLGTRAPNGYNLMPGGSSLGGPSNSKSQELIVAGAKTTYPCLSIPCREFAEDRGEQFERVYPRVQARIRRYGWTPEEAFGLVPRQDRRLTELSILAQATGQNLATLRSRAQRRRVKRGEPIDTRYCLPNPADRNAGPVSAKCFAEATGIPASTIRYRFSQIVTSMNRLSSDEITAHLLKDQDRSHLLTVTLADGTIVHGSKNKLAKLFAKSAYAAGRLSESAIRVRLRKLVGTENKEKILWALGLVSPSEGVGRI